MKKRDLTQHQIDRAQNFYLFKKELKKCKFINQYEFTFEPPPLEFIPSETVPGENISLEQIYIRAQQGLDTPGVYREGYYTEIPDDGFDYYLDPDPDISEIFIDQREVSESVEQAKEASAPSPASVAQEASAPSAANTKDT